MSVEGQPVIGLKQEGSAEPFYPGQSQIGFGALGILDGEDLSLLTAPKVASDADVPEENGATSLADHLQDSVVLSAPGLAVADLDIHPSSNGHVPNPFQDRVVKSRGERRFQIENDGDYFGTTIRYESINVLIQPRQTFEDIEGLADSIAAEGLIQPPIVVRFNRENAKKYLDTVNKVWGTRYTLDDLNFTDDEVLGAGTTVLIAGERRYRACKHLQTSGCSECRAEVEPDDGGSPGKNPACWEKHFEKDMLEVRMGINVSARSALNRQSAENMHRRVPPHQDAIFLNNYWQFVRGEEPTYPLAAFARDVGRSEGVIRDAIKYSKLPDVVRNAVETDSKGARIPYGAAIEIHKLLQMKDPQTIKYIETSEEFEDWIDIDKTGRTVTGRHFKVTDEDLDVWVNKFLTGNFRLPEFRELVGNYILERERGQTSLFDIMQENRIDFEKQQKRLVVEKNTVRALHGLIQYLTIVNDLQARGKLGLDSSPFSSGSPARLMLKMARLLSDALPGAREMSRRNKEEAMRIASEAIDVFSELTDDEEIPEIADF